MVPTYIRFLFAYANSDQNGDGCQGVGCCCGCCGLYAGVQFQATIPTSCWPTIRKSARGRFDWLRAGDENIYKSLRSEEHTSELQSRLHLVCRLLLEKKKLATGYTAS